MESKLLGKSGLRVSELCLGRMTFGEEWGWSISQDVAKQIFKSSEETSGNFIDTANGYTNGTIDLGFPHDFLELVSDRLHGGTFDKIDQD